MKKENRKKILIVDDDKIIREQLEKELKRNFFRTETAANGEETLGIVRNEDIDIILLDIKLPDIDGLEILRRVKEEKPSCEVIIITGFGTRENAIMSLRNGAIDYIEKPINIDELSAALGRACEKIGECEELTYKILVIDDDKTALNKLMKVLAGEGYTVQGAISGKEALDIIENSKIDVIVSDINLGKMDGITVLQKAKAMYQDIEGIMVTGHDARELAVKSLRAGAIDYITKPVNLDELLFSVNKAIERINLNRNRLYRNRELKITSEIISKMNEELERIIRERTNELNRTQAQLFQTSKLATLGEMAAGLAHEMNQPLGGISLIARHCRKLMEKEQFTKDELESALDDIEASVKRMTKVIQHIRTFARQDTMKFIDVRINETIESCMSLLGEQLRLHEIAVNLNLDPDLPLIIGEPYQLEQVWINLVSNARDAVDDKVENLNKGDKGHHNYTKKIDISTGMDSETNSVYVMIHDNGTGLSEKIKNKIFEPFFTTKEVGKATGLGLSISYGIIENHKGKIKVESKEGEGTSIKVYLPVENVNAEG